LRAAYDTLVMPLAPALAHARTYGIAFDLLRAQKMKEDLESRAEHVLDEARRAVGNAAFNIDSPRDICRMLQVLNLPMPSKKPGDTVGLASRFECLDAFVTGEEILDGERAHGTAGQVACVSRSRSSLSSD
jgi:DNA polymerase I-like protein with 3'-5' exonuclease and polymerase domains